MGTLRYALLFALASPCFCQEKAGAAAQSQPEEKIPSQKTLDAILARINHFRKLAGLQAVTEDKDLSRGCQLHAEYLQRNEDVDSGAAHDEESTRPGYTLEGRNSAKRSVISFCSSPRDPTWLVDSLISTLYHRPHLIAPLLKSVGIGYAKYQSSGFVLAIDTSTKQRASVELWEPLGFPVTNQADVPLLFAHGMREWPDPIPSNVKKAGYPITVMFSPHTWQPSEVVMSLEGSEGPVDCWFSSPDKPALKEWPQPGLYAVIPKQPLKPNSVYKVSFKCKQIGIEKTPIWTRTWSFSTADK
jgi:uncharacterized protein YkwD